MEKIRSNSESVIPFIFDLCAQFGNEEIENEIRKFNLKKEEKLSELENIRKIVLLNFKMKV